VPVRVDGTIATNDEQPEYRVRGHESGRHNTHD
jgi:hypothetical protein